MTYVAQTAAVHAFDAIADQYDEIFTFTPVGRAQRQQVWDEADRLFQPGMKVLELNCGTGEDAIHFATRGIHVTAIDASPRMISCAKLRASKTNLPINFARLPVEAITALRPMVFDGAFSNFSGLNCVRDLHQVARSLSCLLPQGAPALLCLSSRFCLWELAWYAVRGDLHKATRRWTGRAVAELGERNVEVLYPSIRELKNFFAPWFRLVGLRGIGIAVPPSYVSSVPAHRTFIQAVTKLDSALGQLPMLRSLGDHILLKLERTTA